MSEFNKTEPTEWKFNQTDVTEVIMNQESVWTSAPAMSPHITLETDLTGDISFITYNDGVHVDWGNGTYVDEGVAGTITGTPTGTVNIAFKENLDRIKEIDVLWYNKNEITHEFEVENTTGITEAIVRGSNIPTTKTKRYIVIPEERQDFFYRKISEPMLKEKIDEYGWRFIFYDTLKTFYEQNKRKEKIELSEFEKLAGIPKSKLRKQQTLQEFLAINDDVCK